MKNTSVALFVGTLLLAASGGAPANWAAADPSPNVLTLSVPRQGATTMYFRGGSGPFIIQMKNTLGTGAAWLAVPEANISLVENNIYIATFPKSLDPNAFYRVVSEKETITDLKGWTMLVQASAPANGSYFVPGEAPQVTVQLLDTFAQGITPNSFSSLNLYLAGPQEPQQTVSAVKLLNASTDRSTRTHHYIDLKKNPGVALKNNILTYKLNPISDEAPGTYSVSVWAALASDNIQQVMKFSTIQIGTAQVESPVVTKTECAACHEGTISGKMYMHHIDPGFSPTGNWALDFQPVESCKSCHNNNGYAAVKDANGNYISDAIVRRVHGVHRGNGLKLPFNTNSVNGDFRNYTSLEFPAELKDCSVCHTDDRWKTQASRLACGSCHDDVWFGSKTSLPVGMRVHDGGEQPNDDRCFKCHDPGGADDLGISISVMDAHKIVQPGFKNLVSLQLTPPANGKYYVNGEAPQLTIQVRNSLTGQIVDPNTIIEPLISTNVAASEWKRGNLYVSGPRADTVPVLTTAADHPNANGYYANNDFRVRRDATKEDPKVSRTSDSIVYQLSAIQSLAPGTYTVFAEVTPNAGLGGWAYLNFQIGSTNIEPQVATSCTDCHRDRRMHESSFAVTYTPDICKSCHDNLHQMKGKIGWSAANNGFGAAPLSRRVHGVHFGKYVSKPKEIHASVDYSDVIFPQDVRNCTKCHSESSTWNDKASRLACLACHDTDSAISHAAINTYDPTPQDPWSGDEQETCTVCHSQDSAFSPAKIHAISNPFVPPYPRE